MDFRKARLPMVVVGVAVFAAAFAAWLYDVQSLRTCMCDFFTAVALPWLLAVAESWVRVPADIAEMVRGARFPARPPWADTAEIAGAVVLGAFAILLAAFRRPFAAFTLAALLALLWIAGAAGLLFTQRALIDALGPPALAFAAFVPTAIAACVSETLRVRRARRYFGSHLSAEALQRILAEPSLLKPKGEFRDVTVLIADIDGFTALSEQAKPEDVIALVDGYLDVFAEQVHAHGGMVDRRIGDAMLAIFNAPFDLADHPRRAIACARALVAALEEYRQTPLAARLSLGRMRIGIETGPAIVGNVGGERGFDYAAHGDVLVAVSRLEVANKALGTLICVGPGTASRLEPRELVHKGALAGRGRMPSLQVYTPAPAQS